MVWNATEQNRKENSNHNKQQQKNGLQFKWHQLMADAIIKRTHFCLIISQFKNENNKNEQKKKNKLLIK